MKKILQIASVILLTAIILCACNVTPLKTTDTQAQSASADGNTTANTTVTSATHTVEQSSLTTEHITSDTTETSATVQTTASSETTLESTADTTATTVTQTVEQSSLTAELTTSDTTETSATTQTTASSETTLESTVDTTLTETTEDTTADTTLTESTSDTTVDTTLSEQTEATTETTTVTETTDSSESANDADLPGNNTKPIVRKKVALTFDDGPDDINTKILVDELNSYGFNATFFVVGSKIDGTKFEGSEVLKYVVDNGNEIGVHAYSHEINYNVGCSDERYAEEISKTEDAIHAVLPDYDIKLMRPVEGLITDERVAESKYPVIHWNIDTYDWKYTSKENQWTNVGIITDKVMDNIKEGDIVLMHEIHDNSLEAAIILLYWLYHNGFEVVTVSELLGENIQPGIRYYSAN